MAGCVRNNLPAAREKLFSEAIGQKDLKGMEFH